MTDLPPAIGAALAQAPRHPIVTTPPPLNRHDRISDDLGIDLWMKRDDLAGPSFGGNKSRQLEYYLGAALAEGADTVLITGAVQSNFVRLAAATAAQAGLAAVVQLEERVDTDDPHYHQSGNVMLNHLLGARIIRYPVGEDENGADAALYAEAERLKAVGKRPYVIPLGADKPPLGALGYIRCIEELGQQDAPVFDDIVVGSGSGATHLGVMAGVRLYRPGTRVTGSCVRRAEPLQRDRLLGMMPAFNDLLNTEGFLGEDDLDLWDGALAPGYGQISDAGATAMALMAQLEGQMLDPVYTAKAFAGVVERARNGAIAKGAKVLFIHTGGLAGLFAYQAQLMD
ncbi:MAG: D-cysteine desulfhydrase family protein [Alphaproteobacteria bacterium]|nr:D-cysteine desulfhydrase family protein [Alphaproteobacteria bacterium]